MKKFLIVFVLLFLCSCKSKDSLTYDKQSPESIVIATSFIPNNVTIVFENQEFLINWEYDNGHVLFASDAFLLFLAGDYEIKIVKEKNTVFVSLTIIGLNTNIPYLSQNDLFLKESSFLVFFSKEGCYACEFIMLDVYRYFDKSICVNACSLLPIYQLKYDETNAFLFGPNESVLGVNNLNDLEIPSFPTLLLFENKTVLAYYHGSASIANYLNSL
ncbi:MAG: hypothetical protein AB7V00_03175 [Bacilli bacterium]